MGAVLVQPGASRESAHESRPGTTGPARQPARPGRPPFAAGRLAGSARRAGASAAGGPDDPAPGGAAPARQRAVVVAARGGSSAAPPGTDGGPGRVEHAPA